MAKRIQVGGRIESKEVGGIVTGAAEILDDAKGKKQSVINGETDDELVRLDQSKQDNLTFDNAPTEGSDNPVKSGGVYAADKALSDAIEAILLLIPSAASALNKLVDTAMMNSSIATATATFKGTYNVVTDLSLTVDATHEQIAAALGNAISTADNNDYAFVQIPVSAESTDIRRTERYKFNGTAWGYEYDLNTSGFTAEQWAAINSGITLALVGKLIGLPTSSELQALLGQKQNTLTFDNVPTAGSANPVKSGGVYSAINDEKTAREQLGQTVTGIDGRVENVEEVIPTGAAANNKLVANNSMEAYVTSIIEAITASFTIATADGHINLTLTQTNGRVASITLISSDIASAQALTALAGRVTTAEDNITTLGGRVSTNETDIANLQQLYNDLQQSKPEPVTVLPSTGQQQGVIYRLAGTTSYADYMWNGSTWVLMATYNNAIDPRPKKASQNLVTSGGVFDNMGALDVSELNATENPHILAQYVDLSAALVAIPTDYQKGGMSIKFVQSSDNNYIQFRYMSSSTAVADFTNVTNWQGVDEEPTAGSDNLIKSGGVYNAIENVKDYLPKKQTRVENPTIVAGKIVKWDGTIADNEYFGYTAPILLKAGETIVLNMGGNYYVSASAKNAGIYQTDASGNFTALIYGTAINAPLSYKNESANDIYIGLCSYIAMLPYYIEGTEDAGSKEQQDKIESDIYPTENVLNITAGSSHGYAADILNVSIPQGIKFKVSIENGTGRWGGANTNIKLIYSDSSDKRNMITNGNPLITTAEKDIVQIQVYIGSDNVLSSGTLLMTVQKGLSYVVERVDDIEKKTGVLPQWQGKTIGLYGDSITQLCGNEGVTPHSWADYIQQAVGCNFIPRGWGATFLAHHYVPNVQKGQTPEGVSVWWEFDLNGNRKPVGEGDVVTSYTGMCDWQRIITQFPDTIKDSIDAVILMGGTNDLGANPLGDMEFITGTPSDPDTQDVPWGQSTYFNGGDYDITTFKGAVCSAIMKLQAWMPQAVIIIATPLSAPNKATGASNANTNVPFVVPSGEMQGLTIEDYADAAMKSARYLSTPVIDIFGNTGINHFNRSHHLVDGAHPSSQNGNGITDAGGVMHYDGCKNMARVFLGGLTVIHPKIDYVEWTESRYIINRKAAL